MGIEIFPERLGVFAIVFPEIRIRLSLPGVIVVCIFHPWTLHGVLADEYMPATLALISLAARLTAIFPHHTKTTDRTLFLGMKELGRKQLSP
jgi:hypothetical protein